MQQLFIHNKTRHLELWRWFEIFNQRSFKCAHPFYTTNFRMKGHRRNTLNENNFSMANCTSDINNSSIFHMNYNLCQCIFAFRIYYHTLPNLFYVDIVCVCNWSLFDENEIHALWIKSEKERVTSKYLLINAPELRYLFDFAASGTSFFSLSLLLSLSL